MVPSRASCALRRRGGHQTHGFLRKSVGQRLRQRRAHMAWPQPSLPGWILQESLGPEDVVRDGRKRKIIALQAFSEWRLTAAHPGSTVSIDLGESQGQV